MDSLLSERGKLALNFEDSMKNYLTICESHKYDEKKNPSGYINFGTSENRLCDDILHPKLNDLWKCDFDCLGYKEGWGTWKLRLAMANMMTRFFESHKPVSPNDLFCVTGVTSCNDLLAHCLANPGEVFLVPAPFYSRIYTDFMKRALVEMFPIHVITEGEEDSELTMDKIICAHECALLAKKVVRGIFLINPNNPLGDIYSSQLLMDIMSFCKAYSLHIIVDEVFALSVFSKTEKFHSILKFSEVPDPDRTHVLYGLGKDFAVAGLRIGVIHTKCKDLQKSLYQLSYFHTIPYPIMQIAAILLEDLDWCREFVRINQNRLRENYEFCVNNLKEMGVKVRECPAGLFVWVNLSEFYGSSFAEDRKFFDFLMDKFRLHINSGEWFFCAQPGWFRIVITHKDSYLKEGLKRFKDALKAYELAKKNV